MNMAAIISTLEELDVVRKACGNKYPRYAPVSLLFGVGGTIFIKHMNGQLFSFSDVEDVFMYISATLLKFKEKLVED